MSLFVVLFALLNMSFIAPVHSQKSKRVVKIRLEGEETQKGKKKKQPSRSTASFQVAAPYGDIVKVKESPTQIEYLKESKKKKTKKRQSVATDAEISRDMLNDGD